MLTSSKVKCLHLLPLIISELSARKRKDIFTNDFCLFVRLMLFLLWMILVHQVSSTVHLPQNNVFHSHVCTTSSVVCDARSFGPVSVNGHSGLHMATAMLARTSGQR